MALPEEEVCYFCGSEERPAVMCQGCKQPVHDSCKMHSDQVDASKPHDVLAHRLTTDEFKHVTGGL